MIIGKISDKQLATEILAAAYTTNDTINETIRRDHRHLQRLRSLMEYSFDVALDFGRICFSDDRQAVALIILPDKKKVTLRSICRDIKLVMKITGLKNALKALDREKAISKVQGENKIYHIWYLGTFPHATGTGIGTALMKDLIQDAQKEGRPIYVESRIPKNTVWYEKRGFSIYRYLEHAGRRWACLRIEV
ncbi:MAG TPA: GNAT family N-acetyltransferase [Chitinophaga sp.]|uniref:GNAT family N-acetyltransferase n=1 Tax=Chitinophaga sp. TaxID=1869181 RepID=UPI002B71A7F6|nr:GNAT family N-acetyltransferase [Chitinophaga sp.]HVI47124.1 GNAT family N-acetyltransferase [Chitinophaga sp.]